MAVYPAPAFSLNRLVALEDVDSPYHPEAIMLRYLLEEVAEEYNCELLSFQVNQGTVSFSFDSDELTAEILKILQEKAVD